MQRISSLIDLTLLSSQATASDIARLTVKGLQHNVAALCVLPQHLDLIPEELPIIRATVVNFPSGNEPHLQVMKAIDQIATHQQVEEMDYVFPYEAYLAGDEDYALSCAAEAYQLCNQYGLLFKVILETGALPSPEMIYQMSLDIIHNGCDFIKTSTGKTATGATIPAAKAMLSAILDSKITCGIKLSGGIKTIKQAQSYITLAEDMMGLDVDKCWFRLGASSLLDEIIANTQQYH